MQRGGLENVTTNVHVNSMRPGLLDVDEKNTAKTKDCSWMFRPLVD